MAEDPDGYSGPGVLTVAGTELPVEVVLDARHEPHDGRLHWFGRLVLGAGVEPGLLTSAAGPVELSTSGGRAQARIGDVDPWGRFRITGVGDPPYLRPEPALED